jgi:azurin
MKHLFTILLYLSATTIHAQERSVYIEGYDKMQYSVEEITVRPGTTVNLTLKTVSALPKDQMAHNWVLLKKDTDAAQFVEMSVQHRENGYIDPDLSDRIIASTDLLGGAEQQTITFTAPRTQGKYMFVCTFPAHFISGMKGWLLVQ